MTTILIVALVVGSAIVVFARSRAVTTLGLEIVVGAGSLLGFLHWLGTMAAA